MNDQVLKTITYFAQFSYPPTFEDIYTFLPRKITKKGLVAHLESLITQKKIVKSLNIVKKEERSRHKSLERYTLGGYSMYFNTYQKRVVVSKNKLKKREWFVRIIAKISIVRFIGYSGSLALLNGTQSDDIDIFVITATHRLYTTRFILTVLAFVFGVKRKRGVRSAPDSICMNLFFEENVLKVPDIKRNEYVAHEILQMMPYDIKGDIYDRFIWANKWVFDFFPNMRDEYIRKGQKRPSIKSKPKNIIGNIVEQVLKQLQIHFMRKHRTREIITDTQLWFFPHDFESKVQY